MTPEVKAFWQRTLTKLVEAVGEDEARSIAYETSRRMGNGGTVRQWTAMLLRVASERGTPPLTWLN